jgi:superfamily I DNA/RNA helicase
LFGVRIPILLRYMAFPNDAQKSVIDHRGKPLVVLAGPGSGKTATLVERIMRILAAEPGGQIAFITFTRMSRRDTARKLEERFGRDVTAQHDDAALPRVATLHTFAKAVVHRGAHELGLDANVSVLVPDLEDEVVFEEARADVGIEVDTAAIRRQVEARRYMDTDVATPGITADQAARLLPRIEELLDFYNATDIAGLVNRARLILERDPSIVGGVLLHIDEYQDLNRADQNLVLTLLEVAGCEVVVVGDDDQSIYGARRANPDGIRDLLTRDGWVNVVFRECHRLPGHVLRAAQALLRLQRRPGVDKGVIVPADDGTKVRVYQCTTPAVEVRRIVLDIKRRIEERKASDRPLKFSDFMVLSPHRKGLTTVGERLVSEDIPVRVRTRHTVPDELWKVLLLLRMIRTDDQIALRQWLPTLGLSPTAIRKLRHDAEAAGRRLFDQARAVDIPAVKRFLDIIDQLRGSRDDLTAILGILAGARELQIDERALAMLKSAGTRVCEGGRFSVSGLVRALYEEYGLLDPEEETVDEDKVLLSTLHSSKGLESKIVYILHLDDRFIPAANRDPDQEVRVLYVGMTRAKETLELSFAERFEILKYRRLTRDAASPFVLGIADNLEFIRLAAKDLA